MRILTSLLLLLLASGTALAGPVKVEGVRLAALPDRTQLVFDINQPVEHQAFLLDNPHRLVLDVRDARRGINMVGLDLTSREVKGVRTGIRHGTDLRIVVDLSGPARFNSFLAAPRDGSSHRLVVDVYTDSANALALYSLDRERPPSRLKTISRTVTKMVPRSRDTVVVIDPGHGGKDPGAVGRGGGYEKDAVLAIAKRLKALIDRQPGMRAVLTRSDDRYIPLYQRTAIALKHNADLFISIHADGAANRKADGASVYVLSAGRAIRVANSLLANPQRAAAKLGKVKLHDDRSVNSVLVDMQQDATLETSIFLAGRMLEQLRQVGEIHKGDVNRKSLAVLTSPVIPSILVETAFITNPAEEKKLKSSAFQQRMAEALMAGLRNFIDSRPPTEVMVVEVEEVIEEPTLTPVAAAVPTLPPATVAALAPERARPADPPRSLPQGGPVLIGKATPPPPRSTPAVLHEPAARLQTHQVVSGETLEQVARHYRVDLQELILINKLHPRQLRVPAGTSLVIPRRT